MDSTMAKSIYFHFTSLKKLLSSDEIQQMKQLEDALKSQGKLNPPFGQCYYCKENTHWASDCLKLKMARQQSKTTDKPDYGHFKCGKPDHWARDCPEMSRDKQLDIPPTPRCLETQEATTSFTITTTKRTFPFEDVSEATPNKQRKVEKTTEPQKTRKRIADDSTVSSILSGLDTRSLGLNILGTTWSPASSQLVRVVRPWLPGFNQY